MTPTWKDGMLPLHQFRIRGELLVDSPMNGTSLEDIQKKLEQVLARPVPLVQGGKPLPRIELSSDVYKTPASPQCFSGTGRGGHPPGSK